MKRTFAIILLAALLFAAGCAKKGGADATPVPAAALTAEPALEPTGEPTAEPTETPDPERAEALRIASEHGLTEADIRGEYGLFLEFARTLEANPAIGGYAELVYRIFPVIADGGEYLDREYFMGRLASLSFTECELDPWLSGQYRAEPNAVYIRSGFAEEGKNELPSVVFHELMHFVDFSISGAEGGEYLLDGERLTAEEYLALPMEERLRAVILFGANVILEGGAELYTAKYFAGAARWYFTPCAFLTGLELIYGSAALDELFFSKDTDALFAELLFGAGFTEDEYYDACGTLNWYVSPAEYAKPARRIRPEDILIRLYEHEKGSGWREDGRFLYVLKAINGVAWSGYEESRYADFLEGIEFDTREEYEAFLERLYSGLAFRPAIDCEPPTPVIRDGRFTLAAFASWRDPDTGETVFGAIAAEYDFGTETPVGYELTDAEALPGRLPG